MRSSSGGTVTGAARQALAGRGRLLWALPLAVMTLWLAGSGTASAGEFTPAFDVTVSNANPGARANVTFTQSVAAGHHLIDSVHTVIEIDWQIAAGDSYPVGAVVGQVSMKIDLGCDGSIDTLAPGNLINQELGPSDPSQAVWMAIVNGTWQLLFDVEQTSQPREWQIAVWLDNGGMPANSCAPQEFKVIINGSASPGGAQVIANPTRAGTYLWDDGLLSVPGLDGSHAVFVGDNVVIGTDTDADGLANSVDLDDDSDGFSDVVEASAGTDPLMDCGVNAWPADINNDGFSDITDLGAIAASFGKAVPPASARSNIAPDPPDGFVDISDIGRMAGLFGKSCA